MLVTIAVVVFAAAASLDSLLPALSCYEMFDPAQPMTPSSHSW